MAIKIEEVKFGWKYNPIFRQGKIKFFDYGGGSYEEFGMSGLDHCQRHYYLCGFYFLSVGFLFDRYRKFLCRKPWTTAVKRPLDSFRQILFNAQQEVARKRIKWQLIGLLVLNILSGIYYCMLAFPAH